jgi:two-component system, OmpR family, sensor histidine kinase VicK
VLALGQTSKSRQNLLPIGGAAPKPEDCPKFVPSKEPVWSGAPQFTFDLRLPDSLIRVDADRQRMQEVLTNLLQNAIKYSDQSRRIEVIVRCDDDEVVTYVRDFGVGIPPAELDRIFEGFYRATNVSSSRYGGLGLGLCISKSIISRHGGRIWVQSTEGAGSTFYFALPRAIVDR